MERVSTSLMFVGDKSGQAEEAMEWYVSLFEDSRIVHVDRFGPDEGTTGVKRAAFELLGQPFTAQDGGEGHPFTFTPAISLTVEFDDEAKLDAAFAALADGGQALMPLGNYPFSRKFGWVNDRYGVSWQLNLP